MSLGAQFQMLILALHMALHISSIPDFSLVQVLAQQPFTNDKQQPL